MSAEGAAGVGRRRAGPAAGGRPQELAGLDKALAVLECFQDGGEQGLTDLSRHLGLHPTLVARTLATLERRGYVQQLGARGRYALGLTPLALASAAAGQVPLRRRALGVLQRLADAERLNANLAVLHQDAALFLARVSRNPADRVYTFVGKRVPLHYTGMGKALLLYAPEAEVRAVMARRGMPAMTPRTLTSVDDLLRELAAARERGYVAEREEYHPGQGCVAAPLRLPEPDAPAAAISVALASHELTAGREAALGRALLDAAFEIAQPVE
jgi:IclR family acetate operon transcriptional repressor